MTDKKTDKKIIHRLEQLINRLSIKNGKEQFVRQQIKLFIDKLSSIQFQNFYLFQYWNGGSFSRGIALKKRFDIDNYFIFRGRSWNGLFNPRYITGNNLFSMMVNYLNQFSYRYSGEADVLREEPYSHAIPIELYLGEQSLTIDCIPAIEHQSNGYLIIPNGPNSVKIINRNLEQEALSILNTLHDGRVTKLILLIKYWKIKNHRKIKSYIIERLAEEIFRGAKINGWIKGVRTFFNQAEYRIRNDIIIPDRVYPQKSILDEYSDGQIDIFCKELKTASQQANNNQWNKLFGEF